MVILSSPFSLTTPPFLSYLMLTFWCVGSGENNRDGINGDGGREEARRTGRKFMRESKGESGSKGGRERR